MNDGQNFICWTHYLPYLSSEGHVSCNCIDKIKHELAAQPIDAILIKHFDLTALMTKHDYSHCYLLT